MRPTMLSILYGADSDAATVMSAPFLVVPLILELHLCTHIAQGPIAVAQVTQILQNSKVTDA